MKKGSSAIKSSAAECGDCLLRTGFHPFLPDENYTIKNGSKWDKPTFAGGSLVPLYSKKFHKPLISSQNLS